MDKEQKKHDAIIKEKIISWIDTEGYEQNPVTDKEKLQFLWNTFHSEYGHAIKLYGEQKAFAEYCKGLPSCFNLPFTNFDILKLAKEIGTLEQDASEKQKNKILNNYWNYIANKTMQLFRYCWKAN